MSPFAVISSALSPWVLGTGGACVGAAWWIGGRLTGRPRSTWGRARQWPGNEQATATLDFVLVFPLFAMLVLTFVQLALLIHARIVVGYAAFAAARSAVVWLHQDPEEASDRTLRAAQIGCLAISPGDVEGNGTSWGQALAVAPLYLHSPERLVYRVRRGGRKMTWSQEATRVRITPTGQSLGAHDPVTVEVEHDFYLSVPYGDRIFRQGTFRGLPIHTITDSVTLTHEGYVQSR